MAEYLLYFRYEGAQPPYTLKVGIRKDATVYIYVTRAAQSG